MFELNCISNEGNLLDLGHEYTINNLPTIDVKFEQSSRISTRRKERVSSYYRLHDIEVDVIII